MLQQTTGNLYYTFNQGLADLNTPGVDLSMNTSSDHLDAITKWIPLGNVKGQTGPQGPEGSQGLQGVTGPQGLRGEAFKVDYFNFELKDTNINSLKMNTASTQDVYVVVISNDYRTENVRLSGIDDKNPYKIDLSRHVITWDGFQFTNYGPFTGMAGETGPKGEKGDRGETGLKGDVGATGISGLNPRFGINNNGDLYYTFNQDVNNIDYIPNDYSYGTNQNDANTKWVPLGNIKGPKGASVFGGATGATGEIGSQGNTGATGATGATGPRGESFKVDKMNFPLDDKYKEFFETDEKAKVASTENVYYVVVSDDTRTTEKLDGIDLNLDFKVDLSRHLIVWDGAKFTNYGPFTGMPGETGPKGDVGLSPKLQLYNKNLYYTYKNNAEAITDDNVNDVVGETDSNSKWVKVGIMERENNFDNVNVTINDGNLKLKNLM